MTKKSFIAILVIGLFLTLAGLIVFKALNRKAPAEFPEELPAFELFSLEGFMFTTDLLEAGKTGLVFYGPGCLFCEHKGRELAKHAADFIGNQFLFITSAPIDSAIAYSLRTGIGAVPHFYSLVDNFFETPLLFGLRIMPTTLLYDEDRKLIKGFEGEVNAKTLFKAMHEHGNEKK